MNVKNAGAINMACPVYTTILWVMAFVLVVNTILKGNTVRSAYQSTTGIWMCQWRISMLALLVTVSQRALQMMGHVCRKLHPHSSLGSASVRTRCLDGSVISVFQVTGDTEEIHQENAEVSFPFYLSFLAVAIYFF